MIDRELSERKLVEGRATQQQLYLDATLRSWKIQTWKTFALRVWLAAVIAWSIRCIGCTASGKEQTASRSRRERTRLAVMVAPSPITTSTHAASWRRTALT